MPHHRREHMIRLTEAMAREPQNDGELPAKLRELADEYVTVRRFHAAIQLKRAAVLIEGAAGEAGGGPGAA